MWNRAQFPAQLLHASHPYTFSNYSFRWFNIAPLCLGSLFLFSKRYCPPSTQTASFMFIPPNRFFVRWQFSSFLIAYYLSLFSRFTKYNYSFLSTSTTASTAFYSLENFNWLNFDKFIQVQVLLDIFSYTYIHIQFLGINFVQVDKLF